MLIDRSDDPQNPPRVAANKVTFSVWARITEPISASSRVPRQTGRSHDRNRTGSEFSFFRPCTNRSVHTSLWQGVTAVLAAANYE
jgi:hypothetical protein